MMLNSDDYLGERAVKENAVPIHSLDPGSFILFYFFPECVGRIFFFFFSFPGFAVVVVVGRRIVNFFGLAVYS